MRNSQLYRIGFCFVIVTIVGTGRFLASAKLQQCDSSCSCTGTSGGGICGARADCNQTSCATCTCGTSGCSSSCTPRAGVTSSIHPVVPSTFITPPTVVTNFQARDLTLEGFKVHLGAAESGWIVTIDPSLVGAFSADYATTTFRDLVALVASEVGGCAEMDEIGRTIAFRPAGTCL